MDTINRVQDWARCKRELLPPHHPRAVVARHHSFRHACIGDSGERNCPNEGKQGLIETQDRAGFAVANWDRRVRKKRDDAKMEHGKGWTRCCTALLGGIILTATHLQCSFSARAQ